MLAGPEVDDLEQRQEHFVIKCDASCNANMREKTTTTTIAPSAEPRCTFFTVRGGQREPDERESGEISLTPDSPPPIKD
jgi:hypothetical protein